MANGFQNDDFIVDGDITVNGDFNVNQIDVDFDATGAGAGDFLSALTIAPNKAGSTGGTINCINVTPEGDGLADLVALNIVGDIDPIVQLSTTNSAPTKAWSYNGGFTDVTTAFGSTGTNVQILAGINDVIYIGADAEYDAIDVDLLIPADADLGLTFAYSIAGPGWTVFTPTFDNTEGFTKGGLISFDKSAFSSWASADVNGTSKYYIRITRTTATGSASTPTERLVSTATAISYGWNSSADITINNMTVGNELKIYDDVFIDSDSAGTEDSPFLYLKGYYSGVEETSSLKMIGATDPYLEFKISTSNVSPTAVGVFNIYDDKILFATDNTVDIGADGANRPKDIYASGTIKSSSEFVLRGVSSGYTGSENHQKQVSVQTTDNTATDLIAIPVVDGSMMSVEAIINGIQSDYSDAIGARVFATFIRSTSGDVTVVGTPEIVIKETDSNTNVTVVADTGNQEGTIQVTGITAETWNWVATYNYHHVISNS